MFDANAIYYLQIINVKNKTKMFVLFKYVIKKILNIFFKITVY